MMLSYATKLRSLVSHFFIVRSRFDIDVRNDEEEKVKNDIRSELKSNNIPSNKYKCYFISNRSHGFDFEDLMQDIFNKLESFLEKESFAFSIENINRTILQIKKNQLEKQISVVAISAAAVGTIPIPGVDIFTNTLPWRVVGIGFMAKVLGIKNFVDDNNKLDCVKEWSKYLITVVTINIMKAIGVGSVHTLADDVLKTIPLSRSIISSTISFVVTRYMLKNISNVLIKKAQGKVEIENKVIN